VSSKICARVRPHFGNALDRRTNARIRATSANIARQRSVNVRVRRIGIFGKQSRGLHDLTRLAVAALGDFQIDPSL
jgi:hypothetical protein